MVGRIESTASRRLAAPSLAISSLALAGVLGALGYARRRFRRAHLYLPDRYPNGVWQPRQFGLPAEDVWFQAEDGVTLHGWWVAHRRARGTIVYCHGNSGSIAHQVGVLRRLHALKVNLLAFDYRGYGRSEGRPTEKGLYADGRAAYDLVVGALGQEAAEVLLFGHSLGGAVAIDCAGEREVAGLVVQSSFTHLRDATRASFPSLPVHLLAGRGFQSLEKVRRLAVPKLFIHGSADAAMPLEIGRRLYEEAAEPKELYVVDRGGHNDLYRHGGSRYRRRLDAFRKRCLDRSS